MASIKFFCFQSVLVHITLALLYVTIWSPYNGTLYPWTPEIMFNLCTIQQYVFISLEDIRRIAAWSGPAEKRSGQFILKRE